MRFLGLLLISAAALLAMSPASMAAAWLAPQEYPATFAARPGGAVIGPDGAVTVAMLEGDSLTQRTLKVAEKPPGQPYRAPVALAQVTGYHTPVLLQADRAGNAVLAWETEINGTRAVRAASKPAGGVFTPVQGVSDTGTSARMPDVAIADGKIVLAWMQNEQVRVATGVAGTPLSVHDPLTSQIGYQQPPAVAIAPSGAAVVAWRTYAYGAGSDGTGDVYAAARPAGGDFTRLPDVASVPVPHIEDIRAAMSVHGRATLAWTYVKGGSSEMVLQSASRGTTGDFGPAETVDSWEGSGTGATTLAVADDDTALIAWTHVGTMRYAQRPLGGAFGATREVPGSTATQWAPPQVAFTPDGTARLVWRRQVGSKASLATASVAPDGTSGPQQAVAPSLAPAGSSEEIDHTSMSLAVNVHGDAIVSWLHRHDADPGQGNDLRYRVRAAILDVTPPAIGALQVSGPAVRGKPVTMKVTTSDALSGATATWDFGDGTTEEGESLTKTYSAAGDYTVHVTVTDDAGNVTTRARPIVVSERRPPL